MDNLFKDGFPFKLLVGHDSAYDAQARRIVQRLEKEIPKELVSPVALETILPDEDTIIYLHVLNALIDTVIPPAKTLPRILPQSLLPEGDLWPFIASILINFDPVQARYCGESLRRIVQIVANGAEQTGNLVPAIQLLQQVILQLDPSSSTMTTTHYSFLRLCLFARAYSEAVHVLDLPIYSIAGDAHRLATGRTIEYLCAEQDSSSTYLNPATGLSGRLTSRTYLEYNLLAAMCFMALQNYSRAMFFLEAVLIGPTAPNIVSKVMVEAYKKWLFLGLLVDGEPRSPPKAISAANLKSLRALAKPYECVVDAFRSGNAARFRAEIHEAQQWWIADSNNGLVLEVLNAFRKFAILRLGKTFTALSIAEVARRTSPDPSDLNETLQYINTLIQSGDLNAQLVPPTSQTANFPTLRFLSSSPAAIRTELDISRDLAAKTVELQRLLKYVSDNDHKLEVSKEYVDFLKKLKKSKDQDKDPGGGPPRPMDIDEEIMGDMPY